MRCAHCDNVMNASEAITTYDGMQVHLGCEEVAIGWRIARTDREMAQFLGMTGDELDGLDDTRRYVTS